MKPPKKNYIVMAFNYKGKIYSAQTKLNYPRAFESISKTGKNTYKNLKIIERKKSCHSR